jgi:hypothetical protein
MSLKEFYQQLKRHDWYYPFSDDHSVYMRGDADRKRIEAIAKQSPAHAALLEGFRKHYFTGKPWDTEQAPLPEEPKE